MATMTPAQIRRTAGVLAGSRAALGVGMLLAPKVTLRLAGLGSPADSATGTTVARLFGVRELVLGLMVLDRLRYGVPEVTLLRLNALCDGLDAAALLTGWKKRKGRRGVGVALSASSMWWSLAQAAPD
jgi:hypothetical protein